MPTIEERLRDTGRVWREHVDTTAAQESPSPGRFAPRHQKRRIVLIAASAVVVAGVGIPVAGVVAHRAADHNTSQGGSGASCAGPQLRVVAKEPGNTVTTTKASAHAGQDLTVVGRFYTDGCQDTNHAPTPHPLKVHISLRGHGRTVLLRTVQAHGELGTFRATVRIPAGYPLGATRLTTRTAGVQAKLAEGSPIEPIRLSVVQ